MRGRGISKERGRGDVKDTGRNSGQGRITDAKWGSAKMEEVVKASNDAQGSRRERKSIY